MVPELSVHCGGEGVVDLGGDEKKERGAGKGRGKGGDERRAPCLSML